MPGWGNHEDRAFPRADKRESIGSDNGDGTAQRIQGDLLPGSDLELTFAAENG